MYKLRVPFSEVSVFNKCYVERKNDIPQLCTKVNHHQAMTPCQEVVECSPDTIVSRLPGSRDEACQIIKEAGKEHTCSEIYGESYSSYEQYFEWNSHKEPELWLNVLSDLQLIDESEPQTV